MRILLILSLTYTCVKLHKIEKQSFATELVNQSNSKCETKFYTILPFEFWLYHCDPSFHNLSSDFLLFIAYHFKSLLIANHNKMKTSFRTYSLLAFLGSLKCSFALQRKFHYFFLQNRLCFDIFHKSYDSWNKKNIKMNKNLLVNTKLFMRIKVLLIKCVRRE